jgi:hypothetical protein
MFTTRTATGLTIALLALPATASAKPSPSDQSGGGDASPVVQPNPDNRAESHFTPKPYDRYYGVDRRGLLATSSLAGTTSSQSLVGPDAADAARAGEIANAMEHYERAQPVPAAARPAAPPEAGYTIGTTSSPDDTPAWPEIAFAGVVLLATAGGAVRVRLRRRRRVAA